MRNNNSYEPQGEKKEEKKDSSDLKEMLSTSGGIQEILTLSISEGTCMEQ